MADKKKSTAPKKKTASKPRVQRAKPEKKTRAKSAMQDATRRELRVLCLACLCFILILCYYTDVFAGFGSLIRNVGLSFFGYVAYAIPVFTIVAMVHMFRFGTLAPHGYRYALAAAACGVVSMLMTLRKFVLVPAHFEIANLSDYGLLVMRGAREGFGGGVVGSLALLLARPFGAVGTGVILICALMLLFVAITGLEPIRLIVDMIERALTKAKKEAAVRAANAGALATADANASVSSKKVAKTGKKRPKPESVSQEPVQESVLDDDIKIKVFDPGFSSPEVSAPEVSGKESAGKELSKAKPNAKATPPLDEESLVQMALAESGGVQTVKEDNTPIPLSEEELQRERLPYTFPTMALLAKSAAPKGGERSEDLRTQAKKLVETLASFGVESKVLEVTKGPSVTRFEIQPSTGVKVSKIVNLADDIALNLAAFGVRIEAPIPGKAAVGIEIPNQTITTVSLRDVLDTKEFQSFSAKTAFALGKNITGEPIITDISKMPHLLIAGATGSGKSVCINALITSILYKADPNEVKLMMIDPKQVELGVYNGIPHLLIPVVTDARRAAGALNWAVQEMMKRYKLFAETNVRNLQGYNELAKLNGDPELEKIVIIVDELADLMMVSPHEVEDAIIRLAQLARAAGMHLVIATQRPSVDVITGLIKANVPSRIAFKVASQVDSRTILDMGGAEKLLGRGDMLFLPMGASKPTRIQGAFVTDDEVEKIVAFVKRDSQAVYDEDIIEHIEKGVDGGNNEESGGDADELLPQAIGVVVEAGQASASLLQRRLKVGYSRAGRLVDQLEERGIIGPHEGSKPRAVLISRTEYQEMMLSQDATNEG